MKMFEDYNRNGWEAKRQRTEEKREACEDGSF